MAKSESPGYTGSGFIVSASDKQAVDVQHDFKKAPNGRRSGAGSLTGDPDVMRRAFRTGRIRVALNDGADLYVQIVAHSEGGRRAYFEILEFGQRPAVV